MKHIYKRIIDPGHSWLEVNLSDLIDLRIAEKISGCSYVSVNKGKLNILVYLEEDCDMPIYEKAYKEKYGKDLTIKNVYYDLIDSPECFVRNLPSFSQIKGAVMSM